MGRLHTDPPAALTGVASPGVSDKPSRADHTHAFNVPAMIAAIQAAAPKNPVTGVSVLQGPPGPPGSPANIAAHVAAYAPHPDYLPVVRPEQFGAIADGVTNDTFALQEAINYAATLTTYGGMVELGDKVYAVGNLVAVAGKTLTIRGRGVGASRLRMLPGTTGAMFTLTGARSFFLQDFRADGLKVDGTYFLYATTGPFQFPVLRGVRTTYFERVFYMTGDSYLPLGMELTGVYFFLFRTCGIDLAQVGPIGAGESMFYCNGVYCGGADVESDLIVPVAGLSVTADTPDTTHDALAWTEDPYAQFGYCIQRKAAGSSDEWAFVGWVEAGATVTYSAEKTVGTSWDYSVCRMTVGVFWYDAKAMNAPVLQCEYVGIGLYLTAARAVNIGQFYYEGRDIVYGGNPKPRAYGIYASVSSAVNVHGAWVDNADIAVFYKDTSGIIDGLDAYNCDTAAVRLFKNAAAVQPVTLMRIVCMGTTPAKLATAPGSDDNSQYIADNPRELVATDARDWEVSHGTLAKVSAAYRGIPKARVSADVNYGGLEILGTTGLRLWRIENDATPLTGTDRVGQRVRFMAYDNAGLNGLDMMSMERGASGAFLRFNCPGTAFGNSAVAATQVRFRGADGSNRDVIMSGDSDNARWFWRLNSVAVSGDTGAGLELWCCHADGSQNDNVMSFGRNVNNSVGITRTLGLSKTTDSSGSSTTTGGLWMYGGIRIGKSCIFGDAFATGVTSTATAGGTTTLTTASDYMQVFTGTANQAITFPAANGTGAGFSQQFLVENQSTGILTCNRAGSNTFEGAATSLAIPPGYGVHFKADGVSKWYGRLQSNLATNTATAEPTGFESPSAVSVAYDPATYKITLTQTGGVVYWYRGVRYVIASPYTSAAHTASAGQYFLGIGAGGAFAWAAVIWDFATTAQVAFVNYNSPAGVTFATRECHGLMPWQNHWADHNTVGTYRYSGGSLTAGTYEVQPAAETDAKNTPGFDAILVYDEDLPSTITATAEGSYTHMYIGASSVATFRTAQSFLTNRPAGTYPTWNNVLTGAETEAAGGNYLNVYTIHVPVTSEAGSQVYRTLILQPQAAHASLAAALAEDFRSLSVGSLASLSPEFVAYARITFRCHASYGTTGKVRIENVTYLTGSKATQVNTYPITPTSHTALSDRSALDQHPIASITMATDRLGGRTTAGSGSVEEITVGTGLSLAAGSLTCTVTGGSTPVYVRASSNASQVVTADTEPLEYEDEVTDTDAAWDGSAFTVPVGKGGVYQINACASYTGNDVSPLYIAVNGTKIVLGATRKDSSTAVATVHACLLLAAGDIVTIRLPATQTRTATSEANVITIVGPIRA
jgi:hypothetical protein